MISISVNDRLGKKIRLLCNEDDTIGDVKKVIAYKTGTSADRIILKRWCDPLKDHITLADYEVNDGHNLELYYR